MSVLNFASWSQPATAAADADVDPADSPARQSRRPAGPPRAGPGGDGPGRGLRRQEGGGSDHRDRHARSGRCRRPGSRPDHRPLPRPGFHGFGGRQSRCGGVQYDRLAVAVLPGARRRRTAVTAMAGPGGGAREHRDHARHTASHHDRPGQSPARPGRELGLGARPTRRDAGRSRLLCPRKLPPDSTLRAAVVPAFRGGVQAGLDRPVDAATVHAPAWLTGQPDDAVLPVYDWWQFSTGKDEDFEFLARRIQPAPREILGDFGYRRVDISNPWPGEDPVPTGSVVVSVGGALRPLGVPRRIRYRQIRFRRSRHASPTTSTRPPTATSAHRCGAAGTPGAPRSPPPAGTGSTTPTAIRPTGWPPPVDRTG